MDMCKRRVAPLGRALLFYNKGGPGDIEAVNPFKDVK